MKRLAYTFFASLFLIACGGESSADENKTDQDSTNQAMTEIVEEEEETPAPPKSPRLEAKGMVNGVETTVAYGSPYVKGRTIWGDLVAYDKIWRAGANDATSITFAKPAVVAGSPVEAGTYALFIIPKENADWTVILNEEWSKEEHGVWGAYDHKPEKDVLRFDVKPKMDNENMESLTYMVTDSHVKFAWEKASFKFEVKAQ